MKFETRWHRSDGEPAGEARVSGWHVSVDPGEPAARTLAGLLSPGEEFLSPALETITDPEGVADQAAAGAADLRRAMWGASYVAARAQDGVRLLMVHARDRLGWSWRAIGDMTGMDHQRVRRTIAAERTTWADAGVYVDGAGQHNPPPNPGPLYGGGPCEAVRVRVARAVAAALNTPDSGRPAGAVPWVAPAADASSVTITWAPPAGSGPASASPVAETVAVAPPRVVLLVGGHLSGEFVEVLPEVEGGWAHAPGGDPHRHVEYIPTPEDPQVWCVAAPDQDTGQAAPARNRVTIYRANGEVFEASANDATTRALERLAFTAEGITSVHVDITHD